MRPAHRVAAAIVGACLLWGGSLGYAQNRAASATVTTAPASPAEAILTDTQFVRPDAPGVSVGASEMASRAGAGGVVTIPLALLSGANEKALEDWRQSYGDQVASWSALSVGFQMNQSRAVLSQGISLILWQPDDSRFDLEWERCVKRATRPLSDLAAITDNDAELTVAQAAADAAMAACFDDHVARQRPGSGFLIGAAVSEDGRFGNTADGEEFIDDFDLHSVAGWVTGGFALSKDVRIDLAGRTQYLARDDEVRLDVGTGFRWSHDYVTLFGGVSWAPVFDLDADESDLGQLGFEGEFGVRVINQTWFFINGGFEGLDGRHPTSPTLSAALRVNM